MKHLAILFLFLSCPLWADDFEVLNVDPHFLVWTGPDRASVNEYSAKNPPAIRFANPAEIKNCRLNGVACKTPLVMTLKTNQHQAQNFVLSYSTTEHGPRQVNFKVLGDHFPSYTVAGKSVLNQPLLMAPMPNDWDDFATKKIPGHLLALNPDGNILFYRQVEQVAADFRPHRVNGKTFYSYFLIEQTLGDSRNGSRVILDSDFKFVRKIPQTVDIHEFLMLGEDHFLTLLSKKQKTNLGICVATFDIAEIKNGKVNVILNTLDLLKLGMTFPATIQTIYNGERCKEVFHPTNLQVLKNERLLLGLRESVAIYNRKSKKLEWVLGGHDGQFEIPKELDVIKLADSYPDARSFLSMHAPALDDSETYLTFYGNFSESKPKRSRALELKLSFNPPKIDAVKTILDNGEFSNYMGSVERHSDALYSVSAGEKERKTEISFREVSGGKSVFQIQLAWPFIANYRSYRVANP